MSSRQSRIKLTETSQKNDTAQIILKVPTPFLERFDKTCAQLGYTRTEAIREAMRRFELMGEEQLLRRPETSSKYMKQMMDAIMGPLIEMAKAEQAKTEDKRVIPISST